MVVVKKHPVDTATRKPARRASTRRDHQEATALLTGAANLHVAASVDNLAELRQRIRTVERDLLAAAGPVRASTAAEILGITPKTVRAWMDAGVLTPAENPGTTRIVLDPERLHHVALLVRDLREAGHRRNLVDAVWHRLHDDALRRSDELDEALDQMRGGEGREWREGPDGTWGPAQ